MAVSSTSRTRATNLTGLIDIDALVEANLIRQKTKLNSATQKLKVEQYRQEQYREVITKSKKFYNKYCDILSGGNLLSSNTYNVMKATSSDSNNVTATASTKAAAGSYEVTVNTAATASKYQINKSDLMNQSKITINNVTYDLSGDTAEKRVENLNSQLKSKGSDVTAKFSDFIDNGVGGLVLQSSSTGSDAEFSIFLGDVGESAYTSYGTSTGKNATSNAIVSSDFFANLGAMSWDDLEDGNYFSIDGKNIKIDNSSLTEMCNGTYSEEDKLKLLQDALNKGIEANADLKDKYTASIESGQLVFKSTSQTDAFEYSVNGTSSTSNAGYNASIGSISVNDIIGSSPNSDLIINGKAINFKKDGLTEDEQKSNLIDALKKQGITATFNGDGTLNLESESTGEAGKIECRVRNNTNSVEASGIGTFTRGTDASVKIKDLTTGLEYTHTGTNEITLDEVTFKIDTNAAAGSATRINVKADGTELKDKIVEFINDYNELLGHINTKLYETYDRNYLPLTDEDKEGLSDSEIEKLEKKAQTGLLRNDSYLSSFADDMKLTMTTILEDSGLSLEKIGINPVNDYKAQNGLFTIDEDKLLAAIEEDPDGIRGLFSGENGIITKLKKNLEEHATSTFSRLANKAGVADGVTANTNEMTKDIEERKKLITQMQTALKEKEDALYTKYSRLESSLSSLQSQQSSLSSYFQ